MKKIALLLSIIPLLVCGVSCGTLNTGAGISVPFTDNGSGAPVKVALEVQAKVIPPKFCIGLDVVGE
tara:strand:+ start:279 stop:479 length:201 start_codon:yes stop_codon:yes gene_type:complete